MRRSRKKRRKPRSDNKPPKTVPRQNHSAEQNSSRFGNAIKGGVITFFGMSLLNAFWGLVEPFKIQAALISAVILLFYFNWDKVVRLRLVSYTILVVFITAPFAIAAANSLFASNDEHSAFLNRIVELQKINFQLYNYNRLSLRKKGSMGLFCKDLLDSCHKYDSLQVELAHFDETGILSYSYYGTVKGTDIKPIIFSCVGEANLTGRKPRIFIDSICDSMPMRLDATVDICVDTKNRYSTEDAIISTSNGKFVIISGIPIYDRRFCVRRTIHVEGCMRGEHEFLIADMRNIEDPPDTFKVIVHSDNKLSNIGIWKLRKRVNNPFAQIILDLLYIKNYELENIENVIPYKLSKRESELTYAAIRERARTPALDIRTYAWKVPENPDTLENIFIVTYYTN